ncbi:MAG: HAMP domain-containing protein [Wenzhouxiangella sp.]
MRSLAARFATVTVALVTLAVLGGMSGAWLMATRMAEEAVADSLAASQSMLRSLVPGAIDNEAAVEIKRITGVEVVYITLQDGRPTLVASTLDSQRSERLLSQLPEPSMASLARGDVMERIKLTFDGEHWMARAESIQDPNGNVLGSVLAIDSIDARLARHRTMTISLIGTGALAILIALALSTLIARNIARSLTALTGVVDEAAQGNHEQPIDARGKEEVGRLARAISRLLANLREQKKVVSDLSRHLDEPDTSSQPEVAATPRSGPALVLALEWRSSKAVAMHQAVEALEQWLPQLALWARQGHARLVPGGSARIYLVFEPGNITGLERCLTTLLRECGTSSNPPAMALASGELISAGLDLGRGRGNLISGKPVFHCERLLTEAGPGRLLLSPPAFQELKYDFAKHKAQLVLSHGRISKRKFYHLVSID